MATEPRIDYEDVFADVLWDLDKAKYLLADLHGFFECPDLEYPDRETIDNIKCQYKHIVVMLDLLGDLIEKMATTVTPLT